MPDHIFPKFIHQGKKEKCYSNYKFLTFWCGVPYKKMFDLIKKNKDLITCHKKISKIYITSIY